MKTEITYEFEALPEDMEPDFDDVETLAWIREQIEAGNNYAWFCAKVTARVETEHYVFESNTQYLGGCSYRSREDFVNDGGQGYYTDMCKEALGSLQHELEESAAKGEIANVVLTEAFGTKRD